MNHNKTITLPSGEIAVVLTPEFKGAKAIVDLDVIKRLAKMLPLEHFGNVRRDLVTQIEGSNNLPEMLDIIESELAFHKSVNMITEYTPPQS